MIIDNKICDNILRICLFYLSSKKWVEVYIAYSIWHRQNEFKMTCIGVHLLQAAVEQPVWQDLGEVFELLHGDW